MSIADVTSLLVGALALGFVHGVEPGHGWPVAAAYALERTNKWLYGFAASFILGVGHLVSSIAMVGAFFLAKSYFELETLNEPLTLLGVQLGGPIGIVAGVVLIALGVREYRHGHSHGEGGHSHEHHSEDENGDHAHHDRSTNGGHEHGHTHHDHGSTSVLGRLVSLLPFVGGHARGSADDATDEGLWAIAGFAFVLGFAHEEEFEIIALCAGSAYCLELMLAYALAVVAGIVGLTLLLIAGYERSTERVERLTPYLPLFSAAVLVVMGLGFIAGVF